MTEHPPRPWPPTDPSYEWKRPGPSDPNVAPQGLVVAGYVTAVLIPIVGFFIGLALIIKNRVAHGVAAMIISVAVVVLAVSLLGGPSYEDCIAGLPVEEWHTCD